MTIKISRDFSTGANTPRLGDVDEMIGCQELPTQQGGRV